MVAEGGLEIKRTFVCGLERLGLNSSSIGTSIFFQPGGGRNGGRRFVLARVPAPPFAGRAQQLREQPQRLREHAQEPGHTERV